MGPKWSPNRVLDAEPLGKGSWSALGSLWSRKKLAWRPLGAVLERFWVMLGPKMAREAEPRFAARFAAKTWLLRKH